MMEDWIILKYGLILIGFTVIGITLGGIFNSSTSSDLFNTIGVIGIFEVFIMLIVLVINKYYFVFSEVSD